MITQSFFAVLDRSGVSGLGFSSRDPEIVALAGGGWVVAWDVDQYDGSGKAVLARVYDENFQPISDVFQVNEHTARDQESPKIVARNDGGFDIFFYSEGYLDSGTNQWTIEPGRYVRSYDGTGIPLSGESHLGRLDAPVLTELQNGQYMEVYGAATFSGGQFKTLIMGRLLGSGYQVIGSSFQINTDDLGDGLMDLAIARLNNGNVVALWSDDGIHAGGTGIFGQILTPTGSKVGSQFLVNTYTTGRQIEQRVTVLENGNFVVTWKSGYGQDGSDWGQFAQLFDDTGSKVGSEFQVNTVTQGYQYEGTPVALEGGDFVIVYLASNYDGSTSTAVLAQVFDPYGGKVGAEIEVAVIDMLPDNEFWIEPSAAALDGGGFAVTWAGGNTQFQIYTSAYLSSLTGSEAPDDLTGTDARELIDGGLGADIISAAGGDDTISGGSDADLIDAGAGDDLVLGGDMTELLFGTTAAEQILGSGGDDFIFAKSGGDEIEGFEGDDFLFGEGGNDTLTGGAGNDRQSGGSGADIFVFDDDFGQDIITDFENGVDRIDIDLVASIDSYSDLAITGTSHGTLISLTNGADDTILLLGVQAGQIDATDFIFL